MKEYTFYYSPTGSKVTIIAAKSLTAAKKQFYKENPQYRKRKGEIYWEVHDLGHWVSNPGNLLKKLKKGITGRLKIVGKGRNRRLEIHT